MKKKYFTRVDRQVAVLLGAVLILFSISIFWVSTQIYYDTIRKNLTSRVESIHAYIEHQLTPEGILEIDDQQELERALAGETVLPEKILGTGWGDIFIAYYPLHDREGMVVGALGIEIRADVEAAAFKRLTEAVCMTCLLFCTIAFGISIFVFRRISNPLYRDMSNTDFMTNLKNRNSYETDRKNLTARKKMNDMTVAVVDVNNLKLANDRLGHHIGDECIMTAAKLLHSTESSKITAYRYGGDEFVILMEDQPDPEELFGQIREKFRAYAENLEVPVALAVGYAAFDEKLDRDIADTQKRADERMYQDKMKIKQEEERTGSK